MSPSNINSFVGDLVQMATAFENLPKIEQELEQTKGKLNEALETVQERELAIVRYKQDIDDLHAKVRSLEVERDDASFRVLEAEDQARITLDRAATIKASVEAIICELDPPKPEPVKEPEPQPVASSEPQAPTTPVEGQSALDPINSPTGSSMDTHGEGSVPEAVHSISETSQSESSPTSVTMDNTSATQDVHNVPEAQAVSSTEPTHGPYFGKCYRNIAGYVNFHDWIAGGGTEVDYYYGRKVF